MLPTHQKRNRQFRRNTTNKKMTAAYEKGTKHHCRLEALFKGFQEYHITIRKEECQLGMAESKWFGHISSKHDMRAHHQKLR